MRKFVTLLAVLSCFIVLLLSGCEKNDSSNSTYKVESSSNGKTISGSIGKIDTNK